MSGVNKVIIVGRLGNDPESKAIGSGQTVTKLSVATSETWLDKGGQKQERTEWHRVTAWGKLAENAAKYLAKGRQVYVEGKLQTSSYDKNGVKMYATEVVASTIQFLGSGDNAQKQQNNDGQNNFNMTDFGPPPDSFQNEDIPF